MLSPVTFTHAALFVKPACLSYSTWTYVTDQGESLFTVHLLTCLGFVFTLLTGQTDLTSPRQGEVTEVMKYKASLISHRFFTFSFCVFKHITRQLAFPKTQGTRNHCSVSQIWLLWSKASEPESSWTMQSWSQRVPFPGSSSVSSYFSGLVAPGLPDSKQ